MVNVRGGTYEIKNPIVFDGDDSGTDNYPIVYQAYNGETVTLKGSQSLDSTKIQKVEDEAVLNRLTDQSARDNLYMVNLGEQNVTVPWCNIYSTRYGHVPVLRFYLNGESLHEARWPNASDNPSEYFTIAYEAEEEDGYNGAGQPAKLTFTDDEGRSSNWDISKWDINDASIIGGVSYLWSQESLKIDTEKFDGTNKIVYTSDNNYYSQDTSASASDMRRYIYFSNVFEEIDAPGESYVDRDSGILYFYYEGDLPENSTLEFANNYSHYTSGEQSNLRNILRFEGASDITFSGIDFKYSSDSMIKIDSASDSITIKDAVLHGGGRKTVMVIDGSNHKIQNCVFSDFIATAISLNGGDREKLTPGGTVITNNKIYSNYVCAPAVSVEGVGHIISHNEFNDLCQSAVKFIRSNNCIFEYNDVRNCQKITDDCGSFYSGRNISELGNIIRYNYFGDMAETCFANGQTFGANPNNAIFIDDGGAGPEIYGNIFNNAGWSKYGPVRTNGGNNVNVHDNIIMNSHTVGSMRGWDNSKLGLTIAKQPASSWLSHNCFRDALGGSNNVEFGFNVESTANNPKSLMFSEYWKDYYTNVEPTGNWADLFTYYTEANYNDCKDLYDEAIAAIKAYNEALKKGTASSDLQNAMNTAKQNLVDWVENNLPQIVTNKWKNNVYINVTDTDVNGSSVNGANDSNNLNLGSDTSVFADYNGGNYNLTDEALATIRKTIPTFENLDYNMMGIIYTAE